MIDLRTQGVRPATVSYTPLDLRGIKANLMGKVQEVETNATAGRNLISKLDFKDGYYLQGLSKELQKEYTTKVQALVDDLYKTGDTRNFSANVARVANEINVDPRTLAGLKDFEMSKRHDQMSMDPRYNNFDFLYTSNKRSTGDISAADWRNKDISPEDVMNFYQVVSPADEYNEYTLPFRNTLASIKVQDIFARDPENGTITYRSEEQIRDLPPEQIQKYRELTSMNLSPAEALAYSLKTGTAEQQALYSQLASDYAGEDTQTAINYKRSKKLNQDEFIGEVVFQSFPYLGAESYEQKIDTSVGKGSQTTETATETTPVTTQALATIVYPTSQDADKREEYMGYLEIGDSDLPQINELLTGSEEDKEGASYMVSLLNDWEQNGDPQYKGVYQNGAELRSAADAQAESILASAGFNTFVSSNNLKRPGETNYHYFQRLKNTMGYLGKSSDVELHEDKDEVLKVYSGLGENSDLVNQITFGVGVLTPEELKAYLKTTNRIRQSGGIFGYFTDKFSPFVDGAISAMSKASDEIKFSNGQTRNFLEYFNEEGALTDAELLDIKKNSPLAFLELAKRDYARRANIYYTDSLMEPGQLQKTALADATRTMQDNWATRFANVGPDFFQNWEVKEYVTASEGGEAGTKSTGLESPRVTTDLELLSPYQKLDEGDTKAVVQKFISARDTQGLSDTDKARVGSWTFGGILIPQGLESQTALMFAHTSGSGSNRKTKTYMFTPKDPTQLSTNPVFKQMQTTQQTLAGKRYLAFVEEGEGFVNQYAQTIGQTLLEKVDVQDVDTDYYWTNTRDQLNNTKYFSVADKINDATDNIYATGDYSVIAAINNGAEVYKVRNKDGTGNINWRDYLEQFSTAPDTSNTFMGVADYENFIISLYHNQEMLKSRGVKITDQKIRQLLAATEMGTLQDIADTFETDFDQLLDTPITFIDRQEALKHFSGQSNSPKTNDGYPRAGYFPK